MSIRLRGPRGTASFRASAFGHPVYSRVMRITGGTLRGRVLKVPAGLRPTQDMVRQAIFSAIGARVEEARVLDLFAGTGALGLEAWSRGATSVTWVEQHGRTATLLAATVRDLCGEGAHLKVVRADAMAFLGRPAEATYDLVLADPPYDPEGRYHWPEKTLRGLLAGPIVTPDALVVFEMGRKEEPVIPPGWALAWERDYGDTKVIMGRRTGD